jgi:hypothetical protein
VTYAIPAILLGLALFVLGNAVVAILLVKLPEDYFCRPPSNRPSSRHPVLAWTLRIGKNAVGWLAVLVGLVLILPGVPGPGLVAIVLGIALVDFPGKRRLEFWLITRPRVFGTINRLRARFGSPPLHPPEASVDGPT